MSTKRKGRRMRQKLKMNCRRWLGWCTTKWRSRARWSCFPLARGRGGRWSCMRRRGSVEWEGISGSCKRRRAEWVGGAADHRVESGRSGGEVSPGQRGAAVEADDGFYLVVGDDTDDLNVERGVKLKQLGAEKMTIG
ncbi:hypothetical protein SASPL_108324 [Salvia splendens]|uniref:Uncharacterized protein n=1 Tax=Salvia splendens TaxID=180675 RepID=A0A8X8YI21_SALSN|nr:hypothetical protein SASPL_108324 [Salvia splendens]